MMKFIYYIDEDNWTLGEGYIFDIDYQITVKSVYSKKFEDKQYHKPIAYVYSENIYDNIETAKNILKGMIKIQRDKNSKEIERLQKENEILFEKLLNV